MTPKNQILRVIFNLKTSCFEFTPDFSTNVNDNFKIDITFKNKKISSSICNTKIKKIKIKIPKPKLWSIEQPNLYSFVFTLISKKNKYLNQMKNHMLL